MSRLQLGNRKTFILYYTSSMSRLSAMQLTMISYRPSHYYDRCIDATLSEYQVKPLLRFSVLTLVSP